MEKQATGRCPGDTWASWAAVHATVQVPSGSSTSWFCLRGRVLTGRWPRADRRLQDREVSRPGHAAALGQQAVVSASLHSLPCGAPW